MSNADYRTIRYSKTRAEVAGVFFKASAMLKKTGGEAWDTMRADSKAVLTSEFLPLAKAATPAPNVISQSAIFRVADKRKERVEHLKTSFNTPAVGEVKFEGPELRQSDLSVFLALLEAAKENRVSEGALVKKSELLATLGRAGSGVEYKRLMASISALQRSLLTYTDADGTVIQVQLLGKVGLYTTGEIRVVLDPAITALFSKGFSQINLATLAKLKEGLQTWLYCYLCSFAYVKPATTAELQAMCGSEAAPAEFKRMLKGALEALVDAGALVNYALADGLVYFYKK